MTEMTCRQAHRLIQLRLDGELADAHARQLDQHLAACAHCARLAQDLGRLDGALREGLSLPIPAAGLAEGVRERAARTRPRRVASWRPLALAAAAVAVAAIVYGVARHHSGPEAPAVIAGSGQSLHVFAPGAKVAHAAETGEALQERTVVWGTDEARIPLHFADGARLSLSEDAVIRIGRRSVTLFKGSVHADLSRTQEDFALATPWGVVGGSRSTFSLTASPGVGSARLVVVEGAVRVRANGGERVIQARRSVLLRPVPADVLVL
jgi:hypothetical protein